jgi:signal transduction histidine kinase
MKKVANQKRMSQAQRRYLESRLTEIVSEKKRAAYNREAKDPPNIKTARKLIEQYDNSVMRIRDKALDSINKAAEQCRQTILFSPEEEAIRLVALFEGKKF